MTPILFDLDGTLIDVSARHYSLYKSVISGQGVEALPPGDYWRHRRAGESTIDLLAVTPGVNVERFTAAWMDGIEQPAWLALDEPYEGAVEIIEALRSEYDLVLITLRRDRVALMAQLDALQMRSYFTKIICHGPELVRGKHQLKGVAELPPGGYAVGDTEADIELASQTGRQAICLSYGVRSGCYLASRGAETVISSLRELPEVITAAELPDLPRDIADVEQGVALRNVHLRASF
ncbi:MAG: HAD family hydrolase [Chloroflexi bacterium]|nr:HAD family hydrolase [Chloroflexota bacterium]